LGAHGGGVVDGGDGVGVGPASVRPEELQRHDADLPVDSHHSHAVVPHRPDGPGHVGAVPIIIERVVVVVDEVPAMHVVDEAVVVVVDAVPRDLSWIGPDVGGQVGVANVDPGIDDGHHHAPAPGAHAPGALGPDICPRGPSCLPPVVQGVHLRIAGVVGNEVDSHPVVGLGVAHVRIVLQAGDGRLGGLAAGQLPVLGAAAELAQSLGVDLRAGTGMLRGTGI